jgi:hypothetical protein
MAKLESKNIYIESGGIFYKFMNCKVEPGDGSFYITLLRDGANSETVTFDSVDFTPITISHDEPRKKLVRISYHSSGCVLYRHTEISANYFEPICHLTKKNIFAAWSIPSIDKLDQADAIQDDDFVFSIQADSRRIEFTLILAPWNEEVEEEHLAIRYEGLLSLIVIPSNPYLNTPEQLKDHFMTLAPNKGLFAKQVIANDQALIDYHQKINNTNDMILYSPNKSGINTIITAVPMRIAPILKIKYQDDRYETEMISCKNNVIKFKVKNEHGRVVKKDVPIIGVELDSRL